MKRELNIKYDGRGKFNSEIIECILENRGIKNVDHFLNPSIEDIIPSGTLYRIEEAAENIVNNLEGKFLVYYDCDV